MTTSVKIHVNGRYKAYVTQKNSEGQVVKTECVHGNYEGSPNPTGEKAFWLTHPATGTFEISEEQVADSLSVSEKEVHSLSAASLDIKEPPGGGI